MSASSTYGSSDPKNSVIQIQNAKSEQTQNSLSDNESQTPIESAIQALQQIPSQPALKSKNKISIPSSKVDPSKVYHKTLLVRPPFMEYYFTPASLLSGELRDDILSNLSGKDIQETALPLSQRIKTWTQHFCKNKSTSKIFLVEKLIPLTIREKRSVDFYKEYGRGLREIIESQWCEQHPTQLSTKSHTNQSLVTKPTTTTIRNTPNSTQLLTSFNSVIEADKALGLHHSAFIDSVSDLVRIGEKFDDLKLTLSKLVNRLGPYLSPYTSTRLLWDALSQSVITQSVCSKDSKEQLRALLLKHWEKCHFLLCEIMTAFMIDNFSDAGSHENSLRIHLETLHDKLDSVKPDDPKIFSKLIEVQASFLKLLDSASSFTKTESKQRFYLQITSFFPTYLRSWNNCQVTLNPSRSLINQWLLEEMPPICTYLSVIKKSEDLDTLPLLESACLIKDSLEKRQWITAYEQIGSLRKILSNKMERESEVILFQRDKSKSDVTGIPRFSEEDFIYLRCAQFVSAFEKDFSSIISEGRLFLPVSEVAFRQLKESFNLIQTPLSKTAIQAESFSKWVLELKKNGYSEPYDSWNDLQECWMSLKAEKKNLTTLIELKGIIAPMLERIASEDYTNVIENYQKVHNLLLTPSKRWVSCLSQLNKCIENVQKNCIVMLLDPNLATIDPNKIKELFSAFNRRLSELVKPISQFYNAFNQLICFGKQEFKGISKSQTTIQTEGSLQLNLFGTQENYFTQLSSQVSELRQSNIPITYEIEQESAEFIPEPRNVNQTMESPNDLKAQLKTVFQSTKRRVVFKDLLKLLKELNITFHTQFGKGDHNKIYINGIPIPLPVHEEWRPGTANSIENNMLEQLKIAIQKKESTSNRQEVIE